MKKSTKTASIIVILLSIMYLEGNRQTKEHSESPVQLVRDTISVMTIDTTKQGIIVFYPKFSRIDLVCEEMPPPIRDSNVVFCCEGVFTGGLLQEFSHSNIAGDHVSEGIRYKGYRSPRNNGAFVLYDRKWKFLHKFYDAELDSAALHGGMGFGQEMMIHEGTEVPHTRPAGSSNIFRALCEIDGKLCLANANEVQSFGTFIKNLLDAGATEALYLDMGSGWNCSWVRTTMPGDGHYLFPKAYDYTTNWITFYYENGTGDTPTKQEQ